VTLFRAGNHLAVVGSADLLRDLLAPRVGLVLGVWAGVDDSRVAFGLEPGLADDFRFCGTSVRGLGFVTLLHERRVAVLHRVVVGGLGEVDLAGLPECLFALLLLAGQELGHEGVVTLSHIFVPAFLHLILDHVLDELGLGDAP